MMPNMVSVRNAHVRHYGHYGHHTKALHPRKLNAQEPFSRETLPAHLSPSRNSATPPYSEQSSNMPPLCGIHTVSLTSRSWNEPKVDMPDLPVATTPGKAAELRCSKPLEKLRVPYSQTLSVKHSFFLDATRIWNNIPDDATRVESLDTFKSRLAGLRTIRT